MRYAGLKTGLCPVCGGEVCRLNGITADADAVAYIAPIEPWHPATETLYNIRGEPVLAVTGEAIPDLVDESPWGFRDHRETCRRPKPRPTAGELRVAEYRLKREAEAERRRKGNARRK